MPQAVFERYDGEGEALEAFGVLHMAVLRAAPAELLVLLCRANPAAVSAKCTASCANRKLTQCMPIHLARPNQTASLSLRRPLLTPSASAW